MSQPDELITPFEKGNGNQTCTYEECISWYELLDAKFNQLRLFKYGRTSVGKPLHLAVISKDSVFDPQEVKKSNKCVLLINNGIHPGEPDGIDASMMFARDLLTKKEMQQFLDHVVVCIIPVYNVSGMLNRSRTSRVNQNGPEEYGFRGTAQNYDLNRDFIKCDAKETESFQQIFHEWQPEIFIDTHVSNGADYQYTMTLISAQKDKLHPILSEYQEKILLPNLYKAMEEAGFEMIPYVNPVKEIPDSGISAFLETPRYSTGYVALFNCIGMMPETHMLKPYSQRVNSTYSLELEVLKIINRDYKEIRKNKLESDHAVKSQKSFTLEWQADESRSDSILFKGYAAKKRKSDVSDSMRLWYDRTEPYSKTIKFYNSYVPSVSVEKPYAYIIPQAWEEVIERLVANGAAAENNRLTRDTVLEVSVYYIEEYKTTSKAFEGHYLHYDVKLRKEVQRLQFYRGDLVVFPNVPANRYIIETLEPQATDSYFAWNFFDPILMRKEYFSDYVFEDIAAELLKSDPTLREKFNAKKHADTEFAKDPEAQLNFIYMHSPYFEKPFNRYPVARVESPLDLPLR